jgi:hypothetical protein
MTSKDSSPPPSPASGVQACDLEVPAGLGETGVLRRTVEGSTRRLSLRSGLLSEAADWMDRKARLWGRLFDVFDETGGRDRPR